MIIVNADDFGGWRSATDAACVGIQAGRISSVTAMVFMEDSENGADIAGETGVDVGLHLNFNLAFTGRRVPWGVANAQEQTRRFLRLGRYAALPYYPWLSEHFRLLYRTQVDEFFRLYGRLPSHVDGHQHLHLCTNTLLDEVIPRGQKVRRSFSFLPGERGFLNRWYRRWVDNRLRSKYVIADYFFALSHYLGASRFERVCGLARNSVVEVMTHPEKDREREWLMGDEFERAISDAELGTYRQIPLSGTAGVSLLGLPEPQSNCHGNE